MSVVVGDACFSGPLGSPLWAVSPSLGPSLIVGMRGVASLAWARFALIGDWNSILMWIIHAQLLFCRPGNGWKAMTTPGEALIALST